MPEKLPVSEVRFNMSDGSAIVPYGRPLVSEKLQEDIEQAGLTLKREHHVTLLPRLDDDSLSQVGERQLAQMKTLLDKSPIDDALLVTDRVYEIRKRKVTEEGEFERRSVIVAVQSDQMKRVLGRLSMVGITTPQPFLHMTIATAGDPPYASRGIGIDSLQEFWHMDRQPFPSR